MSNRSIFLFDEEIIAEQIKKSPRELFDKQTAKMLHRYRRKANKLKAGKGAMDELAIKELSRLIDYLKSIGWTGEQIVKLLEYITAI